MADKPIHILGAGLSGLSAAIILANAGKEVHVYDVREDSGARFDGDFQGIENWTTSPDFFDEMRNWGIDPDLNKVVKGIIIFLAVVINSNVTFKSNSGGPKED